MVDCWKNILKYFDGFKFFRDYDEMVCIIVWYDCIIEISDF